MSDDADEREGIDPVLVAILQALLEHAAEAGGDLSLARLSKRAGAQMSVLRRVLTQLADADLVVVTLEEDGRGSARLTDEGQALCGQLFGAGGEGGQTIH
ncbi:MAG: ArsR family transcriptional regulator [Cupriavidus sp.]|nr:ArsR family transcriptional regulator [Cupriavidus sp.]